MAQTPNLKTKTPEKSEALDPLVNDELLAEMIRALVKFPRDVRVVAKALHPSGTELQIYVNPDDRRHVIGRQGRMISQLRQFFGVVATHQKRKITLEVMESAEERRAWRTQATPT